MVVSVNYLHTRGWHKLRSRNISPPQALAAINLYEACGAYLQNQLITSLNARINPKFSLTGSYTWNHANSDTDGAGTFPSDPNNLRPEYSRAGFDIRQRVQMNGVISAPWGVRLSPFLVATSGRPFNITVGRDPQSGHVAHRPPVRHGSDPRERGTHSLRQPTWHRFPGSR